LFCGTLLTPRAANVGIPQFHKRSAVEEKFAGHAADGKSRGGVGLVRTEVLSAAQIDERCRSIKIAVAARKERFPEEVSYVYGDDDKGQQRWNDLDSQEQHLMANCFIGL
jgi:hypothetical protein